MKKRLCTLLLAVLLLAGAAAVPAHAADGFSIPQAVWDLVPDAPEAAPDGGAQPMTAEAFNYLAALVKEAGTYENGTYLGGDTVALDNGVELEIVIGYSPAENAVLVGARVPKDLVNRFIGVLAIHADAEAPFVEGLVSEDGQKTFGVAVVTSDYVPNRTVEFTEFHLGPALKSTLTTYNSNCITAIISYLETLLETGGYSVDDLGLVAAARVYGANKTPFNDVRTSDYFYQPVLWALSNNITNGTGPTTFSPNDTCTRAQVVTFLWRSAGSPAPKSSSNPFRDVDVNQWYGRAVLWAVEKGVTNGVDATHFGPDQFCTRGQVVTFLSRALNGKPTSTRNPFSDVAAGEYYYNSVLWAVEKGITNGVDATHFGPDNTCTRGQIVTFLWRAAGKPAA